MSSAQFKAKYEEHTKKVTNQFFQWYKNKVFVDVIVHAGAKTIQAHKLILSGCSSFFHGIFGDPNCKDSNVYFHDVSYESMKALIEYMYTGDLEVKWEYLPECLQLADSLRVRGISALHKDEPTMEPVPVSEDMQKTISSLMKTQSLLLTSNQGGKNLTQANKGKGKRKRKAKKLRGFGKQKCLHRLSDNEVAKIVEQRLNRPKIVLKRNSNSGGYYVKNSFTPNTEENNTPDEKKQKVVLEEIVNEKTTSESAVILEPKPDPEEIIKFISKIKESQSSSVEQQKHKSFENKTLKTPHSQLEMLKEEISAVESIESEIDVKISPAENETVVPKIEEQIIDMEVCPILTSQNRCILSLMPGTKFMIPSIDNHEITYPNVGTVQNHQKHQNDSQTPPTLNKTNLNYNPSLQTHRRIEQKRTLQLNEKSAYQQTVLQMENLLKTSNEALQNASFQNTLSTKTLNEKLNELFGEDPYKDIKKHPTTNQNKSSFCRAPKSKVPFNKTPPMIAPKIVCGKTAAGRARDWHIDESEIFDNDETYEQHKHIPCPQPESFLRNNRLVYGCPECNKAYTLKSNYRRHYIVVHKRLEVAVFKCPMCDKRFTRTDNRSHHIKRIHGFTDTMAVLSWDQPFFVCPICKKGFIRSFDLESHIRFVHNLDCTATAHNRSSI